MWQEPIHQLWVHNTRQNNGTAPRYSKTDHTCHVTSPTMHLHVHASYHGNIQRQSLHATNMQSWHSSVKCKTEFKLYLGSSVTALFNTSNMSSSLCSIAITFWSAIQQPIVLAYNVVANDLKQSCSSNTTVHAWLLIIVVSFTIMYLSKHWP